MLRKILFIGTLVLFNQLAWAAAPNGINYQGRLLDTNGVPVTSTLDFEVKIYSASTGGTLLFSETHSGQSVNDGVYSFTIGNGTPETGSLTPALFESTAPWLELVIGGETLSPRSRFQSTPFSLQAEQAETAEDADRFGGRLPVAFQDRISGTCADGQAIQTINSDGTVTCEEALDGQDGQDGLSCWDLNSNYSCDLASEDSDNNGICNAQDCQGPQGTQGVQGLRGFQGDEGERGPRGFTGPAGSFQSFAKDFQLAQSCNQIQRPSGTEYAEYWDCNLQVQCENGGIAMTGGSFQTNKDPGKDGFEYLPAGGYADFFEGKMIMWHNKVNVGAFSSKQIDDMVIRAVAYCTD